MSDNQQHIDPTANNGQPISLTKPSTVETNHPNTTNQPQQPIIIESKNGGRGIATGALVLSILALGASGFLFVEGQNVLKQQENSVQNALKDAALGESDNAQSLKIALEQQDKLNQNIMRLSKDQNEDHQLLANMQRSYNELLKGRVNWLIDETEVMLNVASQQLLLSGNVSVAISTLNTIEQRLKRFDQPELIPIKKAVSDDLSELKAQGTNYLDVSSTSLKVDSLEKSVASLPLLVDSTLQPVKNEAVPTATDADFWTRTWDKTIGMLKGMVEIRKLESNDAMLLSPEQIYFIRANLRLRLLDARLALLQHNNEIYKKNLDEVKLTVNQYFDTNSPTTQEWLKTLEELNQQNLQIVSDTALSRSQTAIRNYQNQADGDNQPISMNEISARSNIVLPSIATHSPKPENKAASDVTLQIASPASSTQAASTPVIAASKVTTTTEKSIVPREEKPAATAEDKSEPKSEQKTTDTKSEAASGVTTTANAVTAGVAGLATVPVAKALSDKINSNKSTDTKIDKSNKKNNSNNIEKNKKVESNKSKTDNKLKLKSSERYKNRHDRKQR